MSTTFAPETHSFLSDTLPPHFTYDVRPNTDTLAYVRSMPADSWAYRLVSAPYADERMADIVRYAVVLMDDRGADHLLGRVIQCGPQTWEAFNSDASHSFGNFRTAATAAAFLEATVEW